MKRLLLLAVVGVAVWQAWVRYPDLLHPQPKHQVMIENLGPVSIERVRVTLGTQTFVKELLEPSKNVTFNFPVGPEASFSLEWLRSGNNLDSQWQGGHAGPNPERHVMSIQEDGSVTYRTEPTIRSVH